MVLQARSVRSPLGLLLLVVDDAGRLVRIDFPGGPRTESAPLQEKGDCCDHVASQLVEYFAGQRRTFDLQLAPEGTPFQLRAWQALLAIPFGQTRSYQQQALAIGNQKAMRAVGGANGKNPIPIVVPCHRVIGKDGGLTGFGGGLAGKQWLLDHESDVLHDTDRGTEA